MFADVYINIPVKSISKSYTYIIPPHLEYITRGFRVIVPFHGRLIEGFVVRIYDEILNEEGIKYKAIISTIDSEAWFTPKMIKTADFISSHYLCSKGEAMRLFIPGKKSVHISRVYEIGENKDYQQLCNDNLEIIQEIEKKTISYKGLSTKLKNIKNLNEKLYFLLEHNYLISRADFRLKAKKLKKTIYKLNLDNDLFKDENVNDKMESAFKKTPAQLSAIKYFLTNQNKSIDNKALEEVKITRNTIKKLVEQNILLTYEEIVYRNSYENREKLQMPDRVLSREQEIATLGIYNSANKLFLLRGVTGSGKTQVYIELAKKFIATSQVLILVPEIVLTDQLIESLRGYFPNKIAVIHSKLSINERNDTFVKIRNGEAKIIIGARSAIFAPFLNLSLIILDEAHDFSYKQDESPRYHTKDIAKAMAGIYDLKVVFASATPSIEDYYNALKGEYELYNMLHRINNNPLPEIVPVDMRQELKKGNRNILSLKLQDLIKKTLAKNQQIIIMLNRRGFHTFVMCRMCGFVVKCKECSMPMVYHKNGKLMCHHCDIHMVVPKTCPSCNSKYIKFFGSGTEKLEIELQNMFPEAKVLRLDRDTTSRKFAHEEILSKFRSGEYNILLGTQMVAKGHDIPNVTAVGILSCDSALNIPDFRSGERCFSLITQTAGRAGRGKEKGEVVVQGYSMEEYPVVYGIKQDYIGFYNEEIQMRKSLFYPPFSHLIKLTVTSKIEKEALEKSEHLKREFFKFTKNLDGTFDIMGPAPSMFYFLRETYRYTLIFRGDNLRIMQDFLIRLGINKDENVIIDVNPMNMG